MFQVRFEQIIHIIQGKFCVVGVCNEAVGWHFVLQEVAFSIPDGVTAISHWFNPFGPTMFFVLNEPLT